MKPGDRVQWRDYWGTVVDIKSYPPHGDDVKVEWDEVPGRPTPWIRAQDVTRVVKAAASHQSSTTPEGEAPPQKERNDDLG